jgi:phage-related protein
MATPTVLSGKSYAAKINGVNLYQFGFLVYDKPNLSSPSLQESIVTFPEEHDSYNFSGTFLPRTIVIGGGIIADSNTQYRTNIENLKSLLNPLRKRRWSDPSRIRIEFADQSDRYYMCSFVSLHVASDGPEFAARTGTFVLTLMQPSPFAIANDEAVVTPTGTGPTFTVLDMGSAASKPRIKLLGAAADATTSPTFTLSNSSFYADFNKDLIAIDIAGANNTGSGPAGLSSLFEPGDFNYRYLQGASFTTSWSSVVSNPDEGTIFLVIRPQFAATVASDQYLFEWYVDASNTVSIRFESTGDNFVLNKEIGGVPVEVGAGADAETFAGDTYMVIAASWGPAGMEIYKDGVSLASNATVTGITGESGTAYLGDQAAAARPACKYDFAMMLPYQLGDEAVARMSAVPDEFAPANISKSKTGNLLTDELSLLDFEAQTIEKAATDMTLTNDIDDWDTNGFPVLQPPRMCFYVPTGEVIGTITVNYRKRYL